MARHLLHILDFLEAKYQFEIISGYIRTYHNKTADFITRSTAEEFKKEMERLGLKIIQTHQTWKEQRNQCLCICYHSWRLCELMVMMISPENVT